ncbi:hypothetical protein K502DRAFT_363575 [Neoconidiobolus thromboides FSU 785]|nr:hypothetical protein K502DRAFT_363575 [Neoconidiobolus thromboides FSU 785]
MKFSSILTIVAFATTASAFSVTELISELGTRANNPVEQGKNGPTEIKPEENKSVVNKPEGSNGSFTDDLINKGKEKVKGEALKYAKEQALKPSIIFDNFYAATEPFLFKIIEKAGKDPELKKVIETRFKKLLDHLDGVESQPKKSKRDMFISYINKLN